MLHFYCFYDYNNIDAIIASWILKRKYNGTIFYPYTKDETIPYVWLSKNYESNIFIFIGTDDFPFIHFKRFNLAAKKFYIFNNNKIYINKYKEFKDLLSTELREIMDVNKSLIKMVWEYIFPDVKIPRNLDIMDKYILKKYQNFYLCPYFRTIGTKFETKINYIQDMRENYIRNNVELKIKNL